MTDRYLNFLKLVYENLLMHETLGGNTSFGHKQVNLTH